MIGRSGGTSAFCSVRQMYKRGERSADSNESSIIVDGIAIDIAHGKAITSARDFIMFRGKL